MIDVTKSPSSLQQLLNESSPYSIKSSETSDIQRKHEKLQNSKGNLYAVAKNLFPTYTTAKIIADINDKEENTNTQTQAAPPSETVKPFENQNNTELQPINQVEFDKENEEEVQSTMTKDSDESSHNKNNTTQPEEPLRPANIENEKDVLEEIEHDQDGDVRMMNVNMEKKEPTIPKKKEFK